MRALRWSAVAAAAALALWLWWPSGDATTAQEQAVVSSPFAGGSSGERGPLPPVARESEPMRSDAASGLEPVDASVATATGEAGAASDEEERDPSASREALDAWLKRNAASAEKYVDRYCDEANKVKRAPPDVPPGRQRDASSFLTVRIDWEDNTRPPGLLHLPEPLRQRLKAYGAGWPAAIREEDWAGLDFSWMTRLHEFDHWNLLAEGPLRESRDMDAYRAPIPNFTELQLWVKLRLARALRGGDVEQASADIHQLVALLRSTNTLIADMVGVALLQLERVALPAAYAYPEDELVRERLLGRTAMYFLMPGVNSKVMKRAFECNAHFKCSALMEGVISHLTLGGAPTLGVVDRLASGVDCNRDLMDWVHRASPRSPNDALEALSPDDVLERFFKPDAGR